MHMETAEDRHSSWGLRTFSKSKERDSPILTVLCFGKLEYLRKVKTFQREGLSPRSS